MPRDKSLSHEKVINALKDEFLEKGFEGASIRSIGARAGMTSAGLYRHFSDKEEMFDALVEPLVSDIRRWTRKHVSRKNRLLENLKEDDELFGETFIDLVRDVIIPKKDEFRLLMTCSAGTKYENFIHDFVVDNQKAFLDAVRCMKKKGYPVIEISEEELHMLLSAYTTACFESIIHNDDEAKIEKHLDTIQDFFMPGWMKIMGVS